MKLLIILLLSIQLNALSLLQETLHSEHILNDNIIYKEKLNNLYKLHNYNYIWATPQKREEIIRVLSLSVSHGVDPQLLHIFAINTILESVEMSYNMKKMYLDILINDAIYSYISILSNSIVNPKNLHAFWNIHTKKYDLNREFIKLLALPTAKYETFFEALAPQHFFYQNTKKSLIQYLYIKEKYHYFPTVSLQSTLRLNDKHPAIVKLRAQLYYENFLENNSNSDIFDLSFENALKAYQTQHSKKPDGILGHDTLKLFQISLDEKIQKISLNLERARWVLHVLSKEYIVVNIASYLLYYIKDSHIEFSTPVIVGKQMHETPVFTGKMHFIVYNPTWTVPYSIAANEILEKVQVDAEYMKKKNLELLNRRMQVVSDSEIDFSTFTPEDFPYTFRQKSGEKNSLGRIKFLFPNSNAIYLHDTPARYLFEQEKREFSHGCIRVKNPFKLSKKILTNQGQWNKDVEALQESLTTTRLTLKKRIPTLLMYWTAAADIEGNIYFYDDHYHLDENLTQAIEIKIQESYFK